MAGGPSLVRIDVRAGASTGCLGTDLPVGEEGRPRTGRSAVRRALDTTGALGGPAGHGRPREVVGTAPHGERRVAPLSPSRARTGDGLANATRAGDSGWYLTTRGLAVVMVSFVAALVLGAATVVHAFMAISGADPQESHRDAAVVMAQHSADLGAQPVAGAVPEGS